MKSPVSIVDNVPCEFVEHGYKDECGVSATVFKVYMGDLSLSIALCRKHGNHMVRYRSWAIISKDQWTLLKVHNT